MKAIILKSSGSPNSLKIKEVEDPKIRANEVLIQHTAIGINFLDVCFRKGQYKLPKTPEIIGFEACGIIKKTGSKVKNFQVGERVAYATGGMGAYATKRAINAKFLVSVPNDISDSMAAATLFKGLTAHALLHRVFIASRAKKILIHSVAGGVGHILCQWAKYLGLEVFGTVGSEEKIPFAQNIGCNHVINRNKQDFTKEIAKITNYGGVGLVYDSIGKDTLEKSLSCLWPMGMCVSFGDSSEKYEKLDIDLLTQNSLYLTRPLMPLYKSNRVELALSADEVFGAVSKGIIKPKVSSYNFADVAKAHQDLESGKTTGSLVLTL